MCPALEKEKPSSSLQRLENGKGRLGHSEQLALYVSAKKRQELVSAWIIEHCPEFVKQARRLHTCGSLLFFHDFFRLGKILLRGGITCKQHLLCAPCALRRSAAYTRHYFQQVKHLLSQHPDWVPVLITKTIVNGPDLAERYEFLHKAHRALIERRRNALKADKIRLRTPTVYASLHGGVGSYEYKRGRDSKQWHPHSHEIAFLTKADWTWTEQEYLVVRKIDGKRQETVRVITKPLDFESALSAEWLDLTETSWRVDVRLIRAEDEDDLFGAVCETMGYTLKMQDLPLADQVHGYEVLHRRRLTYTFGCMRNLELPDEAYDTDESIPADEPWIERVYRWSVQNSTYDLWKVNEQQHAYCPEPSPGRSPKASKKSVGRRRTASEITLQSVKDFLRRQS